VTAAYAANADDAAVGSAFARGEWAVAIEGYRRRTLSTPGDAESHRRLGIALMRAQSYSDALVSLEKAFELGRRGANDTALPAAEAAARAGNAARAIHWLEYVLSTPFGPPLDQVRSADTWASLRSDRRFEEMLAGIEEQRRIMALFDSGSSDEATLALTNSKHPRFQREDIVNSIGYRLLSSGKADDAMAVFAMNAERHPKSANAWDSLAESAEVAGKPADARQFSRRALELVGSDGSPGSVAISNASSARLKRLNP